MAEPWAVVSSWTTPTPLFVLLNVVIGFIALISVFASRKTDHTPPPPPEHHQQYQIHHHESAKTLYRAPSLFSRVTSFNFSSHSYGSPSAFDESAPPPENSPLTSFNSLHLHRSVDSETNPPPPTIPTTDELPPEPKPAPIERAPSLLERLTSFNRVSIEKSETNPPQSEPKIARAPSLLSRMSSFDFSFYRSAEPEPEPAPEEAREQRVTRSATEPKKKKRLPPTMKKSSSEKMESETASFPIEEVDAKADDFINRFKQQLRLQRLDSLLRYRNSAGEN